MEKTKEKVSPRPTFEVIAYDERLIVGQSVAKYRELVDAAIALPKGKKMIRIPSEDGLDADTLTNRVRGAFQHRGYGIRMRKQPDGTVVIWQVSKKTD